jgi:hypothetical protein
LFLPRAPRVGRISPRDCPPAPRLVWRGVRVLASGFLPRRCLSASVWALCCIVCFRSHVARTWSWAVGHPTREAQRSSELVASRHDAGPFVLNTNLRPQRTADHPRWERHCGQGLVRCADEPRAAPFRQGGSNWTGRSVPTRLARDQAQRVNVRSGCSMQSEFKCTGVDGMSSPPLRNLALLCGVAQAAGSLISGRTLTPGSDPEPASSFLRGASS